MPIVTPKSSVPMQDRSSEPQTALRFSTVWMRRIGLDIVIGVKCENISSDRYISMGYCYTSGNDLLIKLCTFLFLG